MTDILAGAIISPADFPPAAHAADATSLLNLTNTAYAAGTPEVGATFTAPTSGAVLLTVGAGLRDNSGNDRVFVAPQVFQGQDATGTEILAPTVITRGVGSLAESTAAAYYSRTTLLSGLTPGATYFARTMHQTDGGSGTADIAVRDITIEPLPVGSGPAGSVVRAADVPPAAYAVDTTSLTNQSNTSYVSGTPEVSVTFVAPTSGRVKLIVGGGVQSSGDRIFLSPEVRETDVAGAVVLAPTVIAHGWTLPPQGNGFGYGSRRTVLDGLTPGATYFARVMHVTATGAGTADITARDITVAPTP